MTIRRHRGRSLRQVFSYSTEDGRFEKIGFVTRCRFHRSVGNQDPKRDRNAHASVQSLVVQWYELVALGLLAFGIAWRLEVVEAETRRSRSRLTITLERRRPGRRTSLRPAGAKDAPHAQIRRGSPTLRRISSPPQVALSKGHSGVLARLPAAAGATALRFRRFVEVPEKNPALEELRRLRREKQQRRQKELEKRR